MKKIVQLAFLITIMSTTTYPMDWVKNKWNAFSTSLSNAGRVWYQNWQGKMAAFERGDYLDFEEIEMRNNEYATDAEIRGIKENIGFYQNALNYHKALNRGYFDYNRYFDYTSPRLSRKIENDKKRLQELEIYKSELQELRQRKAFEKNARKNEAIKLRLNRFNYPSTAKESLKQREKFGLGYE